MLASKMRGSSSIADHQSQNLTQDTPFNNNQLYRKRSLSYPLRIKPIQTQVDLSRIRERSVNLPLTLPKPSLDTIATQIVDCQLPIKLQNICYKEQKKELTKQFKSSSRCSHVNVSPIELNAMLNYAGTPVDSKQSYLDNIRSNYVRLPAPPVVVRQKSGQEFIGRRDSYSPQFSAATAYSNKQRSTSLHEQRNTSRQPLLIASSSVPIRRRSCSTGQQNLENLNKTNMITAAPPLINTVQRSLTPKRRLQGGTLHNSSSTDFELAQYIDRPLLMPYSTQKELRTTPLHQQWLEGASPYSAAPFSSAPSSSQRSFSTEIVNRANEALLTPCSTKMNLKSTTKLAKGLPATPIFNRNDLLSADQHFFADESALSLLPSGSSITITKERSRPLEKKSERSRNSSPSQSRSPVSGRRRTFFSQRTF